MLDRVLNAPLNSLQYKKIYGRSKQHKKQPFADVFKMRQKQPLRGVLRKRCSETCSKYAGEHPCQSVISIKLQSDFIEIAPRHRCSPVNLLHIFRTPFLKNTSVAAYSNADVYLVKFVKFFRTPFFTEYFRWLLLQCIKNRFSST